MKIVWVRPSNVASLQAKLQALFICTEMKTKTSELLANISTFILVRAQRFLKISSGA